MKNNNHWIIIAIILVVIIAIVFLQRFSGTIGQADMLAFYGNLLVVIITVVLGGITYMQTKHMQEEAARENAYLKKANDKANENNSKLVSIIEKYTELEEQRKMPCINIARNKCYVTKGTNNEIEIYFKNIGNTIIKYIDVNEIPEKEIKQSLIKTFRETMQDISMILSKMGKNISSDYIKENDFLSHFKHDFNMIEIDECFHGKAKVKVVRDEENNRDMYVVALHMKMASIYGRIYNENIMILLDKKQNNEGELYYEIIGKNIDVSV